MVAEGLTIRAIRWWQTLKPQYKKLLVGLGLGLGAAAVVFMVVKIPQLQVAPFKAKIQRERQSLLPNDRLKLEHDARKLEHDARTALIQAVGGTVLLIGLFFTWRSIRVTERNLQITQDTAAKNLAIAQDGQITERFTRAIEQLGSDKLEVRLGAIYALERIARDSERDHWPIMEVLTAYVRERAPWPPINSQLLTEEQPPKKNRRPPVDVQAILTVLGRRARTYKKGEDQPLDLSHTDLRGADLSTAHLEGAILRGVSLEKASLWRASLEGAHLTAAHLEEATLWYASLKGAHLTGVFLTKASFIGADLEGARLGDIDTHQLTIDQLAAVKTLYGADLDAPLLEQIQQKRPHLLEKPSDLEARS